MGLFSPWFLAGLTVLGLPLWLHLLKQFRRTPQPFSSLMFFERQIQSSSKHRRLRYLRLLALRLALIALLSLLFANPFLSRTSVSMARKLTVIGIDRSFSMRAQNRLGDAKIQAVRLVDSLPGQQNIQVLALDAKTATITQPERNRTAVRDAIRAIEATDQASSFGEFSRALKVMQQTTGLNLDVHLFSDAQQTSMPASFSDLAVGPSTSLTIHAVGQTQTPNWAIQSVNVPAETFDAANVRLTASVAGWQTRDVVKKVSVLLDGRGVTSQDVSIPASGRAEVEFNNLVVPFGVHRGEVRIEPHDDLPEDDTFLFSIKHADPRKVLFLYNPLYNPGTKASRPANGFYYKSALDAITSVGLRVQVQSMAQASDLDLSSYAYIVLNDPGEVDERSNQLLRDYVGKGGALLIAVGTATQRAAVIPVTGQHVSAASTLQGAGTAETTSQQIFDTSTFQNIHFLITPRIATTSTDRVLARFADGSPLLLEQKLGENRVLIFASTLDNSGSDFALHASFLPFVASTGAYLAGDTGSKVSSMVVGNAIALRQSPAQNNSVDVVGPGGEHEIALSDATHVMAFNPNREGFYDIHPATGGRLLSAVHADRRESNLAQVAAETLNLWRNTGSGLPTPGDAPVTSKVPFSLWRYMLTLVLIATVVESIFGARYLSEERQAT